MGILNSSQKAFCRSTVETLTLTDTCTIYRPPDSTTVTRTATGAPIDTYPTNWQVVASGVKCRVIKQLQRTSRESAGAGKEQATGYYWLKFPYDQNVNERDRVRITAAPDNAHLVGVDFDITDPTLKTTPLVKTAEATRTTT